MNKAEWDELDEIAKNQVVWDTFPDIAPSSNDWVLSTDGGKTGFDFYDTEIEAKAAREEYEGYPTYEHAKVFHWRHCRNFTTDRNACALVLDEIKERGLLDEWWRILVQYLDVPLVEWAVYLADPDKICYCAVTAVCGGEITE